MKKQKIMIVDDNKDIRNSIKEGLKALNPMMEFIEAQNGEECLKLLQKIKPDIILLDIMMPIMDGWITSLNIRNDAELCDIPIIFVSAKNDSLTKNMVQINEADLVEKPFNLIELNKKINARIKK